MKQPNDKGSIYIMVIIILAVVLMMLSMLVIIAGRDLRTSNLYGDGIKAYYIAHSGIAKGISWAKSHEEQSTSISNDNDFSAYPAFHSVSWSVEYQDTEEEYTYKITSSGKYRYNNKIEVYRTIEATVRIADDKVDVLSWVQID